MFCISCKPYHISLHLMKVWQGMLYVYYKNVTKGLLCHRESTHCLWNWTSPKYQNPKRPWKRKALTEGLQNTWKRIQKYFPQCANSFFNCTFGKGWDILSQEFINQNSSPEFIKSDISTYQPTLKPGVKNMNYWNKCTKDPSVQEQRLNIQTLHFIQKWSRLYQ